MPFAELPGPGGCWLYTPGHTIHFIQARLAWGKGEPDPQIGEIISIEDGLITVALDSGVSQFQNHNLDAVRQAVKAYGRMAEVRSRGILALNVFEKFCVRPYDGSPLDPCKGS